MEILSTISTVDSLSGTVISLVKKLVIEVIRARNDVATLPDEVENLQTQYEKLSDRVTRVQEANSKLQEVHVDNSKLGEAHNKEGELEKLLKRLEESLQSDFSQLNSFKKEDPKRRWKKVLWALIGKGANKVQKQIQKILTRLEDDCKDLDGAIAVRNFEGGARTEEGIGRVEIGVGVVAAGVDQVFRDVDQGFRDVKELLTERVPMIPDPQSCGTSAQVLPEYPVAMEERASLLEETVNSLKDREVVGMYGMGGIGKTTLAKQVFNNISGKFVYTCFVNDVKSIQPRELEEEIFKKFQKTRGTSSLRSWGDLTHEKTLIIMDDIDHHEQLASVLFRRRDFGGGSVVMFTTRNSHLCKKSYIVPFEVPLLNLDDARTLFCNHAFDQKDIPEKLQAEMSNYVEEVVNKCAGLPLSLEVIGRHLYGEEAKTWEGTIMKLSRAQGVDGAKEDSLFATLKLSYDALAEEEQQMFRDIATFFVREPLDVALAAMSTSCIDAGTCWGNLVKRCLVKQKMETVYDPSLAVSNFLFESVTEDGHLLFETQHVWMHEHLQDLGKRLAGDSFLSGSNEAASEIVEKINSFKGPGEIKHVRSVSCIYPRDKTVLQMSSLAKVTGLKYFRSYGCRHEDPSQQLPRDLALLQCDFSSRLHDMKNLTVLELYYYTTECCFQPPDSFGGLTKLKILRVVDWQLNSTKLKDLPESFGKLLSLELLVLDGVGMTHLPESFGNLFSLKTLVFSRCVKLTHLPESFGKLSSLRSLTIRYCYRLTRLPSSFSNLSGLRILDCLDTELVEVEDAFKSLSMFQNLQALQLHLRNANVPPSFSQLSGSKTLQYVRLILTHEDSDDVYWDLSPLEGFTSQGKELTALSQELGKRVSGDKVDLRFEPHKGSAGSSQQILTTTAIVISRHKGVPSLLQGPGLLGLPQVQTFPKSFGKLPLLEEQIEKLEMCEDDLIEEADSISGLSSFNLRVLQVRFSLQLKTPPTSVGQFGFLKVFTISGCSKWKTLPESLGQLGFLERLTIRNCGELLAIPESTGQLGSLKVLTISGCPKLKTLPKSLGQLGFLEKLKISDCSKWKTLPESLGQLGSLEKLKISDCSKLKALPESLGQLGSLEKLTISDCPMLKTLPESLGQLGSLEKLTISSCPMLKTLPESLQQLGSLRHLTISSCSKLKTLPESLGQLGSLMWLTISKCGELLTIPESIGQLGSLMWLTISKCGELLTLPESLGQLGSLETLDIQYCRELLTLPESLGQLGSLSSLTIIQCGELLTIPESIGQLGSLDDLYISSCPMLKTLPESLGQLGSLASLTIRNCSELLTIPENIGQLGSLTRLTISKCGAIPENIGLLGSLNYLEISYCPMLKTLPESLGQLGFLETLIIQSCGEVLTLPESIGQLGSLDYLEISYCPMLKTLPDSLGQLGSLTLLAIVECGELLTLPESMGNLVYLDDVFIQSCPKLQAVPQNWGKFTPSSDQASVSSSSHSKRTGLALGVLNCPLLLDFVRNLEWDSREEVEPGCHSFS